MKVMHSETSTFGSVPSSNSIAASPLKPSLLMVRRNLAMFPPPFPITTPWPGLSSCLQVDDSDMRLQLFVGLGRVKATGDHVTGVKCRKEVRMPVQRCQYI